MDQVQTQEERVVLFQEVVQDPRAEKENSVGERPKTTMVRVVLRSDSKTSRVIVEVEDGEDAVGDRHWYRFDFFRSEDPSKNLADARAAYAVLQDLAGTLYRKSRSMEQTARSMEQAANESSAKAKQLESRLQAQATRLKTLERTATEASTRTATEASAKVKQLEARLQAQATRIKNLEQTVFESSARAEQLEAYLQGRNLPDPQVKEKEFVMKLLMLASDMGTSEHERHAAALRARDLLRKYDLLKLQKPDEGTAT